MYFWICNYYESNIYLHDESHGLAPFDYHGFSSTTITLLQGLYGNIFIALRSVFVAELLSRVRPADLAFYMERYMKKHYVEVETIENKEYFLIRLANCTFKDELFSMSAYRLNLVIPVVDKLDATAIYDEIWWANKKILLTTNRDTAEYRGFDCVMTRVNWQCNFTYLRFLSDIDFYKRLVKLDEAGLYKALDFLNTSSCEDTFELKRELASVAVSDGKQFEKCLQKVLDECFRFSYNHFDLKPQVRNRRGTSIRDFIITNHDSNHRFLNFLERKGIELLLFEAKNYRESLTSRDIAVFKEYLRANQAFGKFGIILSRNGISPNCEDTLFEDYLREGMVVLVLQESDLTLMLDKVSQGRAAADVLRDKYYEFSRQA